MDLYTFTVISCLSLSMAGVSYYTGHLTQATEWTKKQWNRTMTTIDLITQYLDTTNRIKARNPKNSDTLNFRGVNVNDNGTCIEITYTYFNTPYIVTLPFQRKYVSNMVMFLAELIKSDGVIVDITQQPGIPYLMSASELGGQSIRITNKGTGQSHEYTGNERPMYAENIMDNE